MPIYEFLCGECGHRFEQLVAAGTETNACPACGEGAKRIMSSPSASPKLVKTAAQNRRLEDKRGVTRGGALERFKQSRRKAGGPSSGSPGKGGA